MGFPPFEKELLHDEYWSLWQQTKLPSHIELLADDKIKRDIWEYRNPIKRPTLSLKKLIKKLFFNKPGGSPPFQRSKGGMKQGTSNRQQVSRREKFNVYEEM